MGTGNRYKCVVCDDYDLCETCEVAGRHPGHNMIKIIQPGYIFPRDCSRGCRCCRTEPRTSRRSRRRRRRTRELDPGVRDAEDQEEEECLDPSCREAWVEEEHGLAWEEEEPGQQLVLLWRQ